MDYGVIFWMVVAGIIGFQLFSALGRDDHSDEDDGPSFGTRSKGPHLVHSIEKNVVPLVSDKSEEQSMPAWFGTIKKAYPAFSETDFLRGASSMYEMVVKGFAKGDLSQVADYIDPTVRDAFQAVIDERARQGHVAEVDFVRLDDAEIINASKVGSALQVVVDFTSNQKRVLRDKDGNVIEGVANRIDLVRDRWTFVREANSDDPNWRLVATDGAASVRKSS